MCKCRGGAEVVHREMVQGCRYNGAGTEVQVLLLSRRCRGDEEVVKSRCRCRDGAEVMAKSRCRAGVEEVQRRSRVR